MYDNLCNVPEPKKMGRPKKTGEAKAAYDSSSRPSFEKMHSIYLRTPDIDRVNRMLYVGKMSRELPPRAGTTMLVRAGLLLLEREMERNEKKFLNIINESHAEGFDSGK